MKPYIKILIILLTLLLSHLTYAMFAIPDLINVPIDRLISNMENKIKAEPNNATYHYILARTQSMAYALNTTDFRVTANDTTPYFYPNSEPYIMKTRVFAPKNKHEKEACMQHLKQAIIHYKKAIELDQNQLPSYLGLSWCLEQSGDTSAALKYYRITFDKAFEQENEIAKQHGVLYFESIGTETGKYLLQLLDPKVNAEEIKQIQSRVSDLKKLGRGITPIIIPLEKNSKINELINLHAQVPFDLDGSGIIRNWQWITPKAGWLVFDKNNTGNITSGLQFFGNVTFWIFWDNGYQALASLDNNNDHRLTDQELNGLAIWQDINCNGKSELGELKSLSVWDVVELSYEYKKYSDDILYSPFGVRFKDGSVRPSFDWTQKYIY